jgi:FkbM family methyltransferase
MKTFKLPKNNIIDPDNEYFTGRNDTKWNSAGREMVMKMITNKQGVIDIGAHVGITTVHWLDNGFNHVHAFEINPSHFECLKENTTEYSNRVTLYPYGCSFEEKTVKAGYRTHKNSGSFQMLDEETATKFSKDSVFEVMVKQLDAHTFDNISLIKIDVEGWELEVMKGSVNTIKQHRPVLFVEYMKGDHKKTLHKYDNNEFINLLEEINYVAVAHPDIDDTIFMPKELT